MSLMKFIKAKFPLRRCGSGRLKLIRLTLASDIQQKIKRKVQNRAEIIMHRIRTLTLEMTVQYNLVPDCFNRVVDCSIRTFL